MTTPPDIKIDPLTGSPILPNPIKPSGSDISPLAESNITQISNQAVSSFQQMANLKAGEPIPSAADLKKEPAVKGTDTPIPQIQIQEKIVEVEKEVPHLAVNTPTKLNRISEVLKEGGMDSASQIKAIERIKIILGW